MQCSGERAVAVLGFLPVVSGPCTGVASTVTLDEQGVRYLFVHQLRPQLREHFDDATHARPIIVCHLRHQTAPSPFTFTSARMTAPKSDTKWSRLTAAKR